MAALGVVRQSASYVKTGIIYQVEAAAVLKLSDCPTNCHYCLDGSTCIYCSNGNSGDSCALSPACISTYALNPVTHNCEECSVLFSNCLKCIITGCNICNRGYYLSSGGCIGKLLISLCNWL